MLAAAILVALPTLAFAAEPATAFPWPGGARAAVSLAYDDALDSQLDHAIPALERYGLRGSFYLTLAGDSVRSRLEDWKAAAARGHELGNHTLFHQCSAASPGREWVEPHLDLDHVSVEEMREQVVLANTMLRAMDGRTERTFTVPCGDHHAAGGNYVDTVKQHFVAIKAVEGGVTPDMRRLDPHAVGVAAPVGLSGEQLIELVREAARKGTMVNLTFHGIGGDYLSVSAQAHEELLRHLAENRDVYWVDTFLNIMRFVIDEN
jgi:peptidoglycan/xylan/chitin deacetylase (PgdA/CDA1 family)